MNAGLKHNIVTIVLVKGKKAINKKVMNTPPPNKYKSKGRKKPNISFPLFVFAGIK